MASECCHGARHHRHRISSFSITVICASGSMGIIPAAKRIKQIKLHKETLWALFFICRHNSLSHFPEFAATFFFLCQMFSFHENLKSPQNSHTKHTQLLLWCTAASSVNESGLVFCSEYLSGFSLSLCFCRGEGHSSWLEVLISCGLF